jgi:hypothetical protein
MTTTTVTLSENASKLLSILNTTGGAWEGTLIELMFEKPQFPKSDDPQAREKRIAHWQYCVNMYGNPHNYHVGNGEFMDFEPTANYGSILSAAYQELRKLGLAKESNSGYNDYFFYPVSNY